MKILTHHDGSHRTCLDSSLVVGWSLSLRWIHWAYYQAFPLGPIQGQDHYGYGFKTGSQKSCPWPESLTHTDGHGHASQKIWILHVQNISKLMLVPLWLQTQPCWVFQCFYCDFSRKPRVFFQKKGSVPPSPTPRFRPDDRAIFIHPGLHVAHLVAKRILLLGRTSKSSQFLKEFQRSTSGLVFWKRYLDHLRSYTFGCKLMWISVRNSVNDPVWKVDTMVLSSLKMDGVTTQTATPQGLTHLNYMDDPQPALPRYNCWQGPLQMCFVPNTGALLGSCCVDGHVGPTSCRKKWLASMDFGHETVCCLNSA